ncbi:fluoride efflux transporter CrcB [Mesobacillus maritimus]|uniref:fluoride efflux transporter CrcB n=1 Tax=Mesobacillus maritimus TaxID=1643336 RepID=UPI00203D94E6|nr:fluoride efflux transporter CrcB [Mesobacillus maritimus]MCM3668715.1 fluoride efflux transporter CrcB [Mesobacillus maritimus]
MTSLLIGLGGAIGALCRYYLGLLVTRKASTPFPLGTWVINVTGSLLLGILFNLHNKGMIADSLFWLVGIGFCGAYTTFSTFGNEAVQLLVANKMKLAVIYVLTSVIVSCIAGCIGFLF